MVAIITHCHANSHSPKPLSPLFKFLKPVYYYAVSKTKKEKRVKEQKKEEKSPVFD